jgi:hypothetical protein
MTPTFFIFLIIQIDFGLPERFNLYIWQTTAVASD